MRQSWIISILNLQDIIHTFFFFLGKFKSIKSKHQEIQTTRNIPRLSTPKNKRVYQNCYCSVADIILQIDRYIYAKTRGWSIVRNHEDWEICKEWGMSSILSSCNYFNVVGRLFYISQCDYNKCIRILNKWVFISCRLNKMN